MRNVFGIVSIVLYCLVGLVCLFMAYTTIRAKKFLPFHEEAIGKKWEELESGMQEAIYSGPRCLHMNIALSKLA
jgi:hypothetical protein